jgi:hypothetical protein
MTQRSKAAVVLLNQLKALYLGRHMVPELDDRALGLIEEVLAGALIEGAVARETGSVDELVRPGTASSDLLTRRICELIAAELNRREALRREAGGHETAAVPPPRPPPVGHSARAGRHTALVESQAEFAPGEAAAAAVSFRAPPLPRFDDEAFREALRKQVAEREEAEDKLPLAPPLAPPRS